jgi:pilus assembly protein Flp/PilA
MIRRFLDSESGTTAIEYALIASGISIAIVAAVNNIGSNVSTMWQTISTSLR